MAAKSKKNQSDMNNPAEPVVRPRTAAGRKPPRVAPVAEPQPPDPSPAPAPGDGSAQPVTLQASRRFWLISLAVVLGAAGVIQGYGYLTAWGNPKKLMERYFNQAQRQLMNRQYENAIRYYGKIIEKNADAEFTQQALIGLASARRELRQWEPAIAAYRQLEKNQNPPALAAWIRLEIGECQRLAKNYPEALQTYRDVAKDFPKSDWEAEARLGEGKVFVDSQRQEEALRTLVGVEKDYRGGFLAAEALVVAGQAYEKSGKPEDARRMYNTVLEKYPATMQDGARQQLQRLQSGKGPEGISRWKEEN